MDQECIETRKIEWTINNFTEEAIEDLYIPCACFHINEVQIFLGNIETKWLFYLSITYLGIHLSIKKVLPEDPENILMKCEIRTLDDEFECFIENMDDKFCDYYNDYDILAAEKIFGNPEKYLDNDSLRLIFVFQLIKLKDKKVPDSANCSSCKLKFDDYFNKELHSDFTFICSDGTKIPAHRFILTINSNVLKRMLDANMLEATTNTAHVEDIDGETMTEILRFIYTKEVKNIEKLAPKLLYGAEKYELNELKELCAKSMIGGICDYNVVEYFILADRYNIKILCDYCNIYIKDNHDYLLEDIEDWDKLEVRHWTIILEYFEKNPKLIINSTLEKPKERKHSDSDSD